ncbi:PEBP-like protein [Serendipita vermifera]|nr:PEBP-like protein [Serendipita vermifera]
MSLATRKLRALSTKNVFSMRTLIFRTYSSSGLHTSEWVPAHAPGDNPLYDMALQVIQEDSNSLKGKLKKLSSGSDGPQQSQKCEQLEILSEMNRPDILWKFERGQGDASRAVFRYLEEQKWRKQGKLDHLMQRIHCMNVVPDLLPDFHPSVDLSIRFESLDVEVGVFLPPKTTIQAPQLHVKAFHSDTRLYTLLMVDPDSPDPAHQTYRTFLHWLVPNIPISSASISPLSFSNEVPASWIPPHPQRGTPYHRYCIFLLEHPEPNERIEVGPIDDEGRKSFVLREFVNRWKLKPHIGGGAHFWRSIWAQEVSEIYKTLLYTPEHIYGHPPKVGRYDDLKNTRKYI